jgi:hypothetical protein
MRPGRGARPRRVVRRRHGSRLLGLGTIPDDYVFGDGRVQWGRIGCRSLARGATWAGARPTGRLRHRADHHPVGGHAPPRHGVAALIAEIGAGQPWCAPRSAGGRGRLRLVASGGPRASPDGSILVDVLPLVFFALSFAAGGLSGSSAQFFGSAVLFLALGLNEELPYRGVIQHATNTLGAVRSVAWVGLLFGFAARRHGHLLRPLALQRGIDGGLLERLRGGLRGGQAAHRHDLAFGVLARLRELLQHPQSQRRTLVVVLIGGCLLRSLCGVAGPPVPSRLTF